MEHELKILPQYFKTVQSGEKTFELRKNNRGYKAGDTLVLKEWHPSDEDMKEYIAPHYTGQEITKEISYILEGGQCGLEEGYCVLGLKQDGIQLKNIDLTGISKDEQWEKMSEEESEFVEAFFCYENNRIEVDKFHLIEEFYDVMQAALGALEKEGITAKEVMGEYPKHLEKLKSRPRHKEE